MMRAALEAGPPAAARNGRLMRVPRKVIQPLAAAVLALLAAACGERGELERPVPLFDEVPIAYPIELWDEGIEGTTILRVRVDETGSVDSSFVLESSGQEAFDSAAVRGVLDLRFEPARRGGEPTAVWAQVPVHFSRDGGVLPQTSTSSR